MESQTPSSRRRKRQKSRRQDVASSTEAGPSAEPSSLADYVAQNDQNMPLLPLVQGWLQSAPPHPEPRASSPATARPSTPCTPAVGKPGATPATSSTAFFTPRRNGVGLPSSSSGLSSTIQAHPFLSSTLGSTITQFFTPRAQPRTSSTFALRSGSTAYYTARSSLSPKEDSRRPRATSSRSTRVASPAWCKSCPRWPLTPAYETPCPPPRPQDWGSARAAHDGTPQPLFVSGESVSAATNAHQPEPQSHSSESAASSQADSWPSSPSTPCPPPRALQIQEAADPDVLTEELSQDLAGDVADDDSTSDSSSGKSVPRAPLTPAASTVCPPPRRAPRPGHELPSLSLHDSAADLSAQILPTSSTVALSPLPTEPHPIPTSSTVPLELGTELLDPGSSPPLSSTLPSVTPYSSSSDLDSVLLTPSPTSTPHFLLDTFSDLSDLSDTDTEPDLDHHALNPYPASSPIKGFHVSSDGGLPALAGRVAHLRRRTSGPLGIQHFCGSPRRNRTQRLEPEATRAFRASLASAGVSTRWWCMHASHTTNLASGDADVAARGVEFVANEMTNCLRLGVPTLCVHLGSDVSGDEDAVVSRVVGVLRTLLATVPRVKLALENMIRTSVCGRSWSLAVLTRILDEVDDARVLVCVDICHAHIAEFDLCSESGLGRMQAALAGLEGRIAGYHVSDSSTPHGRQCEGHANLGDGFIPLSAFRDILRGADVPCYLETPDYFPSARPAHYPEIAKAERERKLAEWALLERVVGMPDELWDGGKAVLERYRAGREIPQQRIRNILRAGGEGPGLRDRLKAFAEDRGVAKVRGCRVRARSEVMKSSKERVAAAAVAQEEAKRLVPVEYTTRGGYTMRRRGVHQYLQ